MNTQIIPTLNVCYLDNSELKSINADDRKENLFSTDKKKPKRFIVNACYSYEMESKSVHISVNTRKVKYATNKSVNTSKVKYAKNEKNHK